MLINTGDIGICKTAGNWDCPFTAECFKDGAQGQWWDQHPEITKHLEKLSWPDTL
jgi:hypothetical protein